MLTFAEMGVYEYVPRSVAISDKLGKLVGVRWVDIDKGTEVRCRLVAQEFASKDGDREDLFAGTPPLMATRLLISDVASEGFGKAGGKRLMVLDIKRAFLYGDIEDRVYIELPDEDEMKKQGYVGFLKKAMYGTRAAPQVWQACVKRTMTRLGFESCPTSPCVYFNKFRDLRVVTHVDDFLCGGPKHQLKWLQKSLQNEFELKSEILGDCAGEVREAKFLGRTISWRQHGIELEGDPKHVDILLKEWNMESCRPVSTPGTAEEKDNGGLTEDGDELVGADATFYRRAAARLNYMSLDRMDLSYAAKEIARTMAKPCKSDMGKIKRVIRYLKGTPRSRLLFRFQDSPKCFKVFSDSDWAGCHRTRKSTSGGVLMHGAHAISHWSSTQSTIALSVAEAELNALIKAGVEATCAKNLGNSLNIERGIELYTDSNSAKGICQRQGCGKVKHLETRQMWLQDRVLSKAIRIIKVPRAENPGDALTHFCSSSDALSHYKAVGVELKFV